MVVCAQRKGKVCNTNFLLEEYMQQVPKKNNQPLTKNLKIVRTSFVRVLKPLAQPRPHPFSQESTFGTSTSTTTTTGARKMLLS